MSNTSGKVFFGFVLGAAVGVAAGLLFAPTSGEDTRKRIREKSREYTDDLAETLDSKLDDLKKYVGNVADDAKSRVRKAAPKEETEK